LEVGAGTGTNFACYPATVHEVVAVEPERRLAALAARLRPPREYRLPSPLTPWSSSPRTNPSTRWPRLLGDCHTHRDTEVAIVDAGFRVDTARHQWTVPAWLPIPVSEFVIGRALGPAAAPA
jgi:hypothetical protein